LLLLTEFVGCVVLCVSINSSFVSDHCVSSTNWLALS